MSRYLVSTSSQRLEIESNITGGIYPVTMAAWVWAQQDSTYRTFVSLSTTDSQPDQHSLSKNTNNQITAVTYGTNWAIATVTPTIPDGGWFFCAARFVNATSRSAFLNNYVSNNSQNQTPSNLNRTVIGANWYNGSPTANHMTGYISRVAMWKSGLSDAQVFSLYNGNLPWTIDRANLVGYWELLGDFDPEPDWSGNQNNMPLVNAPTKGNRSLPRQWINVWSPLHERSTGSETFEDSVILETVRATVPTALWELDTGDQVLFGYSTPGSGEEFIIPWSTFSDGSGGTPSYTGDWGVLEIIKGKEARSRVLDLVDTTERIFSLTSNVYGTGNSDGQLQIRGSTTIFGEDDATPTWESPPVTRSWKYVQVRGIY